jgi:uncharacterized protein
MRIEQDFEVPAAPREVYELLVDLDRVAPCIPGGEVGRREDDGWHPASIAVRLGPMRMNYRGRVRIEERDDASRRAVLAADLREQRGQGAAKAKMTMAVAASDSWARVESVTDVRISGRAGQMGRGVVDDVAARLVAEMAACIAARFAPPGGGAGAGGGAAEPPERAKPISGLRLMVRVLLERLKRSFRRRGGETHA